MWHLYQQEVSLGSAVSTCGRPGWVARPRPHRLPRSALFLFMLAVFQGSPQMWSNWRGMGGERSPSVLI